MLETTTKYPHTICDGGFRIEILQDELTVSRDETAWKLRTSSILSRVFVVLVLVAFSVRLLFTLVPLLVDQPLPALAILVVLIVPGLLWARYEGTNNIHCTRENLEVIRFVRGREAGRWLFPRELVKQTSFAAVSWSNSGSTFALIFKVEGKKVKVLRGIESPEAQIVLRELQRLGFDVLQDVGMQMMV